MSQFGIDHLSEAELRHELRFPSKAEEIELVRAVERRTNFFTQHDFCYNGDYICFPRSLGGRGFASFLALADVFVQRGCCQEC